MLEEHAPTRGTSGWAGWIALAGVLMAVVGTFHVAQGLTALLVEETSGLRESVLLPDSGYVVWGWVHVAVGAVVVVAGFLVFAGRPWARAVGTVMAAASAMVSLGFFASHPLGAVVVIAFDVVVILALTVHGSELGSG